MKFVLLAMLIFAATSFSIATADDNASPIKAGIIGLDTSHVVAFSKLLNSGDAKGPLADVRVVAAFPAGSPDIDVSANRIENFTNQVRDKYGVEIVDSIEALLKKVDVVLLESVDGRPHLAQARPVIEAGKPLFIDKPVAASLADTIEIFELAAKHKVPCFSSSSLRYSESTQKLARDAGVGKVQQVDTTGPVNPLKGHPDLFFYGIHGVEMLFAVLGPGCEEVTWQSDGTVRGVWSDGRIGTFNNSKQYTIKVTGSEGTVEGGGYSGYEPLVVEFCKMFKTGKVPVPAEETINLVAFMTAAQQSKDNGHATVKIEEVMKQARDEIAKRRQSGG
jgi:predicted dehydrogenase